MVVACPGDPKWLICSFFLLCEMLIMQGCGTGVKAFHFFFNAKSAFS